MKQAIQPISELKKQIDLVETVRAAGIELRRAGRRFIGLCPFHSDKRKNK